MELPSEIKAGVPIMLSDVRSNLDAEGQLASELTPEALFRKTCEVALDHWLVTDDENRLRCACGVLLLLLIEDERHEEKLLVERELSAVAALSAAISGIPVDFARVLENPEDATKFVGLVRIWQEMRESGTRERQGMGGSRSQ